MEKMQSSTKGDTGYGRAREEASGAFLHPTSGEGHSGFDEKTAVRGEMRTGNLSKKCPTGSKKAKAFGIEVNIVAGPSVWI
ncbi:MAG TPA: hypothetical protein IAA94_05170 [Candidatus Galloscillospira stercoripullorum]|nr:hypothetical protein [Candidatus Galloscillospira stercoripullorum]